MNPRSNIPLCKSAYFSPASDGIMSALLGGSSFPGENQNRLSSLTNLNGLPNFSRIGHTSCSNLSPIESSLA